jgi:hypothetical protein
LRLRSIPVAAIRGADVAVRRCEEDTLLQQGRARASTLEEKPKGSAPCKYLNDSLARFAQEITRIEVQLSDESSGRKGAADKRCMLEARLNGREPLAVQHHGESQDEAFRGATQKLIHILEHKLGKLERGKQRDRETIRKDSSVA